MRTESVKIMSSVAGNSEQDKTPSSSTSSSNDCLPPSVVQVSREELRKFLKCKRVGNYLLGKTIGEGSFAKVKQGFHVLTGEKVAIKIIDKKQAMEDRYVSKNMRREAKILQMVRHQNVIHLLEVVETENRYYLVFEVASGGDLMDYICYRKKLGEVEVRKFVRQIISAVHYLHQGGVIHRDLKVENLLLDENYNIKIIDFGLSNTVYVPKAGERSTMREHCKTQCGSPAYAAPEILGHLTYGTKVDVWSIGVNMYAMLTGKLPYTAEPFNIITLYNKMVKGEMNPIPDRLSPGCKDLILRFLTFDPSERISIEEALHHTWLRKGFESDPLIPMPFPNFPNPEGLNRDIISHMTNKMQFKEQDVIDGVTSNRSNAASCVYHLINKKLQRYIHQHPTPKLPRRLIKTDSTDEPDAVPKKPRMEDTAGTGYSSSNRLQKIKADSAQEGSSAAGSSQCSQGMRGRLASDRDGNEFKGSAAMPDEADGALATPKEQTVHKSGAFNHMESLDIEDDEIPEQKEPEDGPNGMATIQERKDEVVEPVGRKISETYNMRLARQQASIEISVRAPSQSSQKELVVDNDDNNNNDVKTTAEDSTRDVSNSESSTISDDVFVKERFKEDEITVVREMSARKDSGTKPVVRISPINTKIIAIPLSPAPKPLVQPHSKIPLERKGSLPLSVPRERTYSNQDNKTDTSPFAFTRGRRGSLPSRTYPVTRDPSPIRKPIQEPVKPRVSDPSGPTYGLVCQVTSVEKQAKGPEKEPEGSESAQLMVRSTLSPLSVHCSPKPARRYSTPVSPMKDFYKEVLGFDSAKENNRLKTRDDSSVGTVRKGDEVDIANKGDDVSRADAVSKGNDSDKSQASDKDESSLSSLRPFASPSRNRRYSTSSTSSDDSKRTATPRGRISLPITPREPLLPNLSLKLLTKHPPIEPLNLPHPSISPRKLSLDSYKEGTKKKDRSHRSRRRNTVMEPSCQNARAKDDVSESRHEKESRDQAGRKESRDHLNFKDSKERRELSDQSRETRAARVRRSIDFDSRISVEKVMNDSQTKGMDARDSFSESRDARNSQETRGPRDRRKSEPFRALATDSRNAKPSHARIKTRRQTTELDTRSPRKTKGTGAHVDVEGPRDHRSYSDTRDPAIKRIISEALGESFEDETKSRDRRKPESRVPKLRSSRSNQDRRSSMPVMITARVRHGENRKENGNDSGVKLSDSSSRSEDVVDSPLTQRRRDSSLTNQERAKDTANQEGEYVTKRVVVKERQRCEPKEMDFNENTRVAMETHSDKDFIHSGNSRRSRDRQRRHTVTLPRTQPEASPPVVTSTKYTMLSSPKIYRKSEV